MHTQNCTYLQILVGNYQHILQRTSVAFDFVLACCIAGVSGKENCYHQLATHLKNSTVDSHCSACWGCPGGGQRLEWLQLTKQLSGWRQAWHFLRGFPPDLPPPLPREASPAVTQKPKNQSPEHMDVVAHRALSPLSAASGASPSAEGTKSVRVLTCPAWS